MPPDMGDHAPLGWGKLAVFGGDKPNGSVDLREDGVDLNVVVCRRQKHPRGDACAKAALHHGHNRVIAGDKGITRLDVVLLPKALDMEQIAVFLDQEKDFLHSLIVRQAGNIKNLRGNSFLR